MALMSFIRLLHSIGFKFIRAKPGFFTFKFNIMYIFIKKDGDWYALDKSKITRQIYAECYDSNGQQIGHDVAGTVLEIQSENAAYLITQYARQKGITNRRFAVGDQISATPELDHYYDFYLFQFAYDLEGVDRFEEGVYAYTYRGWSSSHSLFFEFDNLTGFVEDVEGDGKIIRALRAAIGCWKQFGTKSTYGTSWTGKQYRVSTSLYADAWWDFMIEEI